MMMVSIEQCAGAALLIVDQLLSNHRRIPTITRGALIDDIFFLSRTSQGKTTDAYELIRYLKDETEFVPWTAAFTAMRLQEDFLTGQEILLDIQKYFLDLVLPLYHQKKSTKAPYTVSQCRTTKTMIRILRR